MMKQRVVGGLFLSLLLGTLGGCSTTGGDILGLVPAPRFLSGSIDDNNVYIAKDKRFTVAVPFAEDTDDHVYMKVREEYGPHGDYVSFGPGAMDQRIYRIEFAVPTTDLPLADLDTAAPQILSSTEQQAQQAYGGTLTAGPGQKTIVNGRNAYTWDLQQSLPSRHATLAHKLYLIDFGGPMVAVWVQTPNDNISNRKALTPEQFAESLKVMDALASTH